MSPKFRGDQEDWLDSDQEGSSSARKQGIRPKKKVPARFVDRPLEEANAVVMEVFPNQCRIRFHQDRSEFLCSYRRAQVVGKSEVKERTPVAVGDQVIVKKTGTSSGVVEGICARKNSLSRPAPGKETHRKEGHRLHHVLAANIDLLVVVASVCEPTFSSGIVDRFIVAAEAEKIPSILCITKMDLAKGQSTLDLEVYSQIGYPVFQVSSFMSDGIEELKAKLLGKTAVFCGHSGVGKTSLLRVLLDDSAIGKVGEVSEITGKGRHTTTSAIMLNAPQNSDWIDTPGVREFSLAHLKPELLTHCFPEFKNLGCEQASCLHREEPGCQATRSIRYSSYRRILESILEESSG